MTERDCETHSLSLPGKTTLASASGTRAAAGGLLRDFLAFVVAPIHFRFGGLQANEFAEATTSLQGDPVLPVVGIRDSTRLVGRIAEGRLDDLGGKHVIATERLERALTAPASIHPEE